MPSSHAILHCLKFDTVCSKRYCAICHLQTNIEHRSLFEFWVGTWLWPECFDINNLIACYGRINDNTDHDSLRSTKPRSHVSVIFDQNQAVLIWARSFNQTANYDLNVWMQGKRHRKESSFQQCMVWL